MHYFSQTHQFMNNVPIPINGFLYFVIENRIRINIVMKRSNTVSIWNKLLNSQKIAKTKLTIEWL